MSPHDSASESSLFLAPSPEAAPAISATAGRGKVVPIGTRPRQKPAKPPADTDAATESVEGRRSARKRISMTDAWVRGRKLVPEGYQTYADGLVPSLFLKVGKATKVWIVYKTFRGRPLRHHLGEYPGVSLERARTLARGSLTAIERGIDPRDSTPERLEAFAKGTAKPRQGNSDSTFGSVAERFLDESASKKPKSYAETKRIIEKDLLDEWRAVDIAEITRSDIRTLLKRVAKRGGPMANRTQMVLSRVFTFALDEELIDAHPLFRLEPVGGEERSRERTLSAGEIRAFWEAASAEPYPFGPCFKFLLTSAARRGEAASMKWTDIDETARLWRLADTKGGHGDEKPLSSLAMEILASCPRAGDHVFTATGSGPVSGWGKTTDRVRRAAGIAERWTLHDLRRTAATQMAEIGVSSESIRRVLAHAEPGITKVYTRTAWIPQKRDALNRWAEHLATIVGAEAK